MLDALDRAEQDDRDRLFAAVSAMDMAARIAATFTRRPPTKTEETVIRALLDNPRASGPELSKACGWTGASWQMHFDTMAKLREADLWPAEPFTKRDANFYCGILADFDPNGNRFTMSPEVALGFKALGIAARAEGRAGMTLHREIAFEDHICARLAAQGWLHEAGDAARYDVARALFPPDVVAWVQASQPRAWDRLTLYHANRLRVVRQVRYSRMNGNSIDLVLFLNGFPRFHQLDAVRALRAEVLKDGPGGRQPS